VADNVELVGASGNFFGSAIEAPFSGETVKLLLLARADYSGSEGSRTLLEVHEKYSRADTFTVAGNGVTVDLSAQGMAGFALQVKGTGAVPSAWNVVLEVSLDNANWTTVLTHSNTLGDSDGSTKWPIKSTPALYVRARCVSVTLGGASNIVATLLAVSALSPESGQAEDLSTHHMVTSASANAANIKASPGRVKSLSGFNNAGYPVKFCFHDSAGTPTAGSGVVWSQVVQAGSPCPPVMFPGKGRLFTTGIARTVIKIASASDMADAGATATALNDAAFEVGYV
jgi:hypothetical protein